MKDEFYEEDLDDEKTIEFIKNRLPQDLKETFTDDDLVYFLDTLYDYYNESGCLEVEPDAEGYVDIDLETIAEYLAKEAKKDEIGEFAPEDLYFVVEAELEYTGVLDEDEEEDEDDDK